MGLISALLTLPLAPVRGAAWVAEQVTEEARRELYDEDRIRAQLLQLELEAEAGRLGEDERERLEGELLVRLEQAHRHRRGGIDG